MMSVGRSYGTDVVVRGKRGAPQVVEAMGLVEKVNHAHIFGSTGRGVLRPPPQRLRFLPHPDHFLMCQAKGVRIRDSSPRSVHLRAWGLLINGRRDVGPEGIVEMLSCSLDPKPIVNWSFEKVS